MSEDSLCTHVFMRVCVMMRSVNTLFRAAAALRTAGAAYIATAMLGAALTPTNANQYDEEYPAQYDEQHHQPICEGDEGHMRYRAHP